MSEPLKKQNQIPESYSPKELPIIVSMAREQNLRPQETLVETFDVNGAIVDVVDWRETIWCGKLAYGRKNGSEPNVEKLLGSYLALDNPALTREPTEPEWSACISLNYLSERPRGIMFGMQVDTREQPEVYDIYKVPPARFMRVLICEETAQALGVEMWRGGIPPYGWIDEHIAPRCGYRYGSDALPVFEYYGFYDPKSNKHKFCYLYVPVERVDAPESYTPKQVPEIMKLAEEAQGGFRQISEIQPYQDALEIFHMPACRVIGIEQTYKINGDEDPAAHWSRALALDVWKTVEALPRVIQNARFGWTCDCIPKEKNAFDYIVSVLTPADTPVPAGCQFRDIPATHVAAGLWAEDIGQTIERMNKRGFVTRYSDGGCGWNGELYLDAEQLNPPPAPCGVAWRWLIPCKEDAK